MQVGAFSQEKALILSVIVKTDGSFAALARTLDTGLAALDVVIREESRGFYCQPHIKSATCAL